MFSLHSFLVEIVSRWLSFMMEMMMKFCLFVLFSRVSLWPRRKESAGANIRPLFFGNCFDLPDGTVVATLHRPIPIFQRRFTVRRRCLDGEMLQPVAFPK